MNQASDTTTVDVASMPWVFTQHLPLYTSEFVNEAKKRGISLDLPTLRELYRHRLLIPFVELTYRAVRAPSTPSEPEPMPANGRLVELRRARDTGRLRDLAAEPFKPQLPFERARQTAPDWWNGLFYSRYQLLALPMLDRVLAERKYQRYGTRSIARLTMPSAALRESMDKQRRAAAALTALEARYLPNLDPEWIHLSGVPDTAEWEAYRACFDPVQMRAWLQYPVEQVRQDAEWFLTHASSTDPVGTGWGRLMRRAPAKSWRDLKDASLIAMDDRVAAEILLRFYEDLANHGEAKPLPDLSKDTGWHPLHERLSTRRHTLDEDLISLGISPHPRVVLALEGETEMYHAPRILRALELSDAPELIRLLKLGGISEKVRKVAALTAAPLVSGKVPGTNEWNLIKPFTRLVVAVDPEGPYATDDKVASEHETILHEIEDVLEAQGVFRPNPRDLNELIDIQTWDEPCYEFAHFTDEELADGIIKAHPAINGWTKDELVDALSYWRGKKKDIKRVWESGRWIEQTKTITGKWTHEPSKVELAKALWSTLEEKIEQLKVGANLPALPLVQVIYDAYHFAQQWRYVSPVLTELPEQTTQTSTVSTGS